MVYPTAQINTSKRAATTYMGREITFAPNGQLKDFVSDIVGTYVGEKEFLPMHSQMYESMMVQRSIK